MIKSQIDALESAKAKNAAAKKIWQDRLDELAVKYAPTDGEIYDETISGIRIAKRGWDEWTAAVMDRSRPAELMLTPEEDAALDAEFAEILAEYCDNDDDDEED